ncbi:MAG: gliding motility-associated ABC transporter ATP-binding subunit GldA [Bacteroidota bacterium]
MSILVQNVSKRFGDQLALDNVSFEAAKGQVVGFLGPNGAGKSTMMKIITCFLPPTSGEVKVCGHDVGTASLQVRRLVGYLPEHNPLYLEMYVREYLEFIAGLHHLGGQSSLRVNAMIEATGLGDEQSKKIGALSKGYRQRVGLAQALLHDPQVIVLDEPTSGLDPNQLVGIRQLIKETGKTKTVLFSTHIMQEVQAVCDRVVIINKGKIVADEKPELLQRHAGSGVTIQVEFDKQAKRQKLESIEGVENAVNTYGNTWRLSCRAGSDARPAVFKMAVEEGLTVLSLSRQETDLESVFQQLTNA